MPEVDTYDRGCPCNKCTDIDGEFVCAMTGKNQICPDYRRWQDKIIEKKLNRDDRRREKRESEELL